MQWIERVRPTVPGPIFAVPASLAGIKPRITVAPSADNKNRWEMMSKKGRNLILIKWLGKVNQPPFRVRSKSRTEELLRRNKRCAFRHLADQGRGPVGNGHAAIGLTAVLVLGVVVLA